MTEYLFISQVTISVYSIKPCTSAVSVELTTHCYFVISRQ